MVVESFLQTVKEKYIKKCQVLSNMYKVGYQDTETLECKLRLANSYITTLNSLAGEYALSDSEINAIIAHLIILLEIRNIVLPLPEDFRSITIIQNIIIVINNDPTKPMRKIFKYDTTSATTGITRLILTDSSIQLTVTHNLNIINATVEVVEDSGLNINPGIKYLNSNSFTITFAAGSVSTGTITVSE